MGWFVHRDLSVDPDFNYYLPQAGRRPLWRVRTAVRLGPTSMVVGLVVAASIAWLLLGLFSVDLTITTFAAWIAFCVGAMLVLWFRPGYRWDWHVAENLVPGMWVPLRMGEVVNDHDRVAGRVHLTQILAVFEHKGKEFSYIVGLHSGAQWVFKPDAMVPVFELVDGLAWLRAPRPVQSQFEDLVLPMVDLLETLWNESAELPAEDLLAELADASWPDEVVRRTLDAASRLGLVNFRGRSLKLPSLAL